MITAKKEFKENRWKFVIFLLILMITGIVVVYFYPAFKEMQPDLNSKMIGMPKFLKELAQKQLSIITGYPAYLGSQWFEKNLKQFAVIFAILLAMGCVAKEAENKTLELLLSKPVSRTRVILEKFITICAGMFFITLIPSMIICPLSLFWGRDITGITIAHLILGNIVIFSLAFVILSYTFFFSVLFNDQVKAAVGGIILTLVFWLFSLFKLTKNLSIFSHCNSIPLFLKGEMNWNEVSLLFSVGIFFMFLSIYAFNRKEI
jgi:ABC-2 type transport system permease protein